MKILISAHTFSPNIGGIETFTHILANAFVTLGHEVKLMCPVLAPEGKEFSYKVERKPSIRKIIELFQWCDIYYQSNISLKTLWPLLFFKKSLFITHHIWMAGGENNSLRLRDHLKHFVCKFATNIAISPFIGTTLKCPFITIADPYNQLVFKNLNQKRKGLVFVGRLEKEKGVDLALRALYLLKQKEIFPKLTVIGKGKEEGNLKKLSKDLKLESQVSFLGPLEGEDLASSLNRHSIMIIPSVWPEPFGIVALEGIACGCFVIGTEDGGLPTAIGPCGVTVPNNNIQALAEKIEFFLDKQSAIEPFLSQAPLHLSKFDPISIARQYLEVFNNQ